MILEFPEGEFFEAYGYLYGANGVITPAAAKPWAVRDAALAYLSSVYPPGDALPLKILVRFDRTVGDYDVHFEDTDANRWTATPSNFRQLREELRPGRAISPSA